MQRVAALLQQAAISDLVGQGVFGNQGFTVGSALGGSVMLFVVAAQIGAVEPVQRLLAGEDPALTVGVAEAVAAGYAASMIVATVIAAMAVFPVLSLRRHLAPARAAADEARRA
jgi:hypothetical protein